MYKYTITIIFKGDGSAMFGIYEGAESSTDAVARKLFGDNVTGFLGLIGHNHDHNLFVRIEEIAAFDICEYDEDYHNGLLENYFL